MLSVLMSVYKEPIEWVSEAITSILEQSLTDFEFIIIIDDPNSKSTIDLIHKMMEKDSRIKYYINEINLGLTRSLNIGLELCQGKYIVRMDADDISLPGRLAEQYKFMENFPEIVASGTGIEKFGKESSTIIFNADPEQIKINFVLPTPFFTPIAHPTAIIRTEFIRKNNLKYNENYITTQDYALWNDVIKLGKLSNIERVYLRYRVSDNQITSKKRNTQNFNRNTVIRDHITHFVRETIGCNYIVPENITLSAIQELKKYSKISNSYSFKQQLDMFVLCYYLSLYKTGPRSLIYFLTHDALNHRWSFKNRIKIFISHFTKKYSRPILFSNSNNINDK